MDWAYRDISETVTVGELLWTILSVLGMLLCAYLYAMRRATCRDIRGVGLNGETRLLARVRATRAAALFLIFELFALMGLTAMLEPTNPATIPQSLMTLVPPLGMLAIQLILLGKIWMEAVYEGTIATLIALREKAAHGDTPRLSD